MRKRNFWQFFEAAHINHWLSFIVILILFSACSLAPLRQPASSSDVYNTHNTQLLRLAAQYGILFMLPDNIFKEVPSSQTSEQCKKYGQPIWEHKIYDLLETFAGQPKLFEKFHVIEFRRADVPKAEITEDLDGTTYLVLNYSKGEERRKVQGPQDSPCKDTGNFSLESTLISTVYKWPTDDQILPLLNMQKNKKNLPRFSFNTDFFKYLAERQTILRLTSDLAFEKTPEGNAFLPAAIANLSQEIMDQQKQYPYLDFWFSEITAKSNIGRNLKFFAIKRDPNQAHGIQVDSAGKYARKINGTPDMPYPYVSYRIEQGRFQMTSIEQLNTCLEKLYSIYLNPVRRMASIEIDADSFLYPGHHCN